MLIRLSFPHSLSAGAQAPDVRHSGMLLVALPLLPFAGIAFLWFVGVIRDRLGQREDRFFATVYLRSGILLVATLFTGMAMAVGLIVRASSASGNVLTEDTWRVGRAVTFTLITTYAMRMAAFFTIATSTITLRIAIMPRWIGLLGYECAVVLLLTLASFAGSSRSFRRGCC